MLHVPKIRIGGDEFCIIIKSNELTPQCSIGVLDTKDRDNLMKFADIAMYEAKKVDGSEFRFY